MATSTSEELDRNASGRFVRNLALTLSGGALLTLLGAGAAQAQDTGAAGTASDGAGAAGTGDATAVGNQSGTNTTQTVTVSGNLGVIQVINQQANVVNGGVGIANTGGNIAIGNASSNNATADQTANGGATGGASNNGSAANNSNGSSLINTGNASAVGNHSNTRLVQEANGSAQGTLGGILVINQDANVINAGVGVANSGGNAAIGNASGRVFGPNDAGLLQDATSTDGSLANNNGSATNDSNGKAVINTGNASATGNKSDTQIVQRASGSAGGSMGGLMIIDQDANVLNTGIAVANSGLNGAVGNASSSTADVGGPNGGPQTAIADGSGLLGGDIGIASNNGEASNWSDGNATITTGDAGAVGNASRTRVDQSANGEITGGGGFFGGTIIAQNSNVVNAGAAVANSGLNGAVGNASFNDADTSQLADATGFDDVGVVGNFGKAANLSSGDGAVHSGGAYAAGNRSQTDVSQTADAKGGAFNLQVQGNLVTNTGAGFANSGLNAGVGNVSQNDADVVQTADLDDPAPPGGVGVGVVGQFGLASNDSDGSATITTGDATAVGNQSETVLSQEIDPNGIAVQTQVAGVVNAGVGIANSGGNFALGNFSNNTAGLTQGSTISPDGGLFAGTLVAANNGEASNASDGSATIHTGNAAATGNHSRTVVGQENNASIDGLGAVINTQAAVVANVGLGVANSGINAAVGNTSQNDAVAEQTSGIDGPGPVITFGPLISSNSGNASNSSDGDAAIWTGHATGTGNRSETELTQSVDGDVNGLGIVVNTQVGGVLNGGIGLANSGGNFALGNASDSEASLDQEQLVGSAGGVTVFGPLTMSNAGEASNASDGTAGIITGNAEGTGNTSVTRFRQEATGTVDGLGAVVNTQLGGVANVGLGVGNSGINGAVGNVSNNNAGGTAADPGLDQTNFVGSTLGGGLTVFGPLTVSNAGEASNSSDGLGVIHTGNAQGQGNVSATAFGQHADGNVGANGIGIVPNFQVGGVVNAGAGIANSGVNGAIGNASGTLPGDENSAEVDQLTTVGSDADPLTVFGPLTAFNNGRATNDSAGTALIRTGGALATGNASATNFSQSVHGDVDGLGLVVGPQIGLVANVGVGVANSGINGAVGNLSDNTATLGTDLTPQAADFGNGGPLLVVGPVSVGNSGEASNSSNGLALIATGGAVASGNVSTSSLNQDLRIGVDDGLSVVPTTGVILNAGFGLANSGVNGAIGNISDNTATTDQAVDLDPTAGPFLFGPQTVVNGGGAKNASAGTGKVGTGRANATGNLSTSDLTQAIAVDGAGTFAAVNGGITNVGAGLANSGINAGIGNASTNVADLDQAAQGTGTVANNGEASNNSDGFGGVGNPSFHPPAPPALPGVDTPGADTPGKGTLPKTGGPLEVEAALGLMLLLAGFGFRRVSKRLS